MRNLSSGLIASLAVVGSLTFLPPSPVKAEPLAASKPKVFCLSLESIERTRALAAAHDATIQPALDRLLSDADRALKQKPVSVMDKTRVPPSVDKHDYVSIAPYFWPDPKKPDGLPYIRKDGRHNPTSTDPRNSDAPNFGHVTSAVVTLGLAYYFTGKEPYAVQAARLLRTWFLDPATRMNPNLNFGQGIPGVVDGRGTGIIDSRSLIPVVDAVGLLASSPSWTTADQRGMEQWMRDYLHWLQTSKNGKAEGRASNNHGTFYDAQVVSLALFTGQTDLARSVLETARKKRIASQIKPDGSQPRELARTKSFSYSLFNLEAMEELATLGERAGVDLWNYQTADGRGLRNAVEFMAPYADATKPWTHEQITNASRIELFPILRQAAIHYPDAGFGKYLQQFPASEVTMNRAELLYAKNP